MDERGEPATIPIEACPLCGKAHVYDVDVEYSKMSYMTAPPARTFTRFFSCPTTGQMFEAPITVSGSVLDLEVKGVHAP
jgi:hypothetical protein